jgi:hypothetical protein
VIAARPDSAAVSLAATLVGAAPRRIEEALCIAVKVAEPLGFAGLRPLLAGLLELAGLPPKAVVAGDLTYAGSAVAERVAIAQARPFEVAALAELGLGRGRTFVLNVGHAGVAEALALAATEPEFAAYAVVKSYVLGLGGGLAVEVDNRLVQRALEVRCRRKT